MRLSERLGRHTVVVVRFPVSDRPTWDDFRTAGRTILRAVELELDGERAVIKPNVTGSYNLSHPDTGVGTHAGAVQGMVEHCRAHGAGAVSIIEHVNGSMPVSQIWGGTGYPEMARAAGAELQGPEIKLADCVELPTPPPVRMLASVWVPRLLVDRGAVLLNVAKMKTHGVLITLAIKNTQGLVEWSRRHFCVIAAEKVGTPYNKLHDRATHERWQRHLTECHVDLIRALEAAGVPMLHLIEGVMAREGSGFLHNGANRPLGLMFAGRDPVAVDSLAAWCMGFDPLKVVALQTAAAADLGTNRLEEIDLLTLDADRLVPVTDPEAFAVQTPFRTTLTCAELNSQRPYDRLGHGRLTQPDAMAAVTTRLQPL